MERRSFLKFLSVLPVVGLAGVEKSLGQTPDKQKTAVISTPRKSFPYSDYTFDSFCELPSNSFAVAAIQRMVSRPNELELSPLCLIGPPGCGKTHLLHATANLLETSNSNVRVRYLDFESFTLEYVRAKRAKEIRELVSRYTLDVDFLLVDHLQYAGRYLVVQAILFGIIRYHLQKKNQVILAVTGENWIIKGLLENNQKIVESGLIADIRHPEFHCEQMKLVNKMAESWRLSLSENTKNEILATAVSGRSIEGALNRIRRMNRVRSV